MNFVLEWCLKKHKNIHSEKASNLKFCHYYNNNKTCPYSDLGCMFRHEDSPICLNKSKCTFKLCQFKHSQSEKKKQNSCDQCDFNTESAEIIETHIKEFHITKSDKQIEDKQTYDLYVETNFPEIFDCYLKNENHLPCYFCDYSSKSQILKNIKNEMIRHMETNHEKVIEAFKSDNTQVENLLHLEFLEYFLTK